MNILKNILGAVVGLVIAIGLVWLVQRIGHYVYPIPEGYDFSNPDVLANYVKNLPTGAFLFVIASYAAGTLVGGWMAGLIGTGKPVILASFIAVFVLVGAILNVSMIPHPTWFTVTAVVSIVLMALLAGKLVKK